MKVSPTKVKNGTARKLMFPLLLAMFAFLLRPAGTAQAQTASAAPIEGEIERLIPFDIGIFVNQDFESLGSFARSKLKCTERGDVIAPVSRGPSGPFGRAVIDARGAG